VAFGFEHVLSVIPDSRYLLPFLFEDAHALDLICKDDSHVFFLCLPAYK
jgi:thiazole synthase ThiGH ThiG subunit